MVKIGWLSNSIPGYPETLNLQTQVHTRPLGIRPEIELEPTEHPLALEQRNGISWGRVKEIVSIANHYIDSVPSVSERQKINLGIWT